MIGAHYLVDLGPLVPTLATSPRDAYALAVLSVFGAEPKSPPEHPVVYRIAPDGEVLEVTE